MKNLKKILKISLLSASLMFIKAEFLIEKHSLANCNEGYNDTNQKTNGELKIIKDLIPGKGMIFDIGANIGDWSSDVLQYHPYVSIFAFEPQPQLIKGLTHRLKKFDAHVFPIALSDCNKTSNLTIYSHSDVNGCSSLYNRPVLDMHDHFNIEVPVISLDEFCKNQNIQHIDFLKIDTEGNEYKVLLGARKLLELGAISKIQFAYGGTYLDSHIKLEDIFNLLRDNGFKIYRISHNKLIMIDEWDDSLENFNYANYIALLD